MENPDRYTEYFASLREAYAGYPETDIRAAISRQLAQIETQLDGAGLDPRTVENERQLAREAAGIVPGAAAPGLPRHRAAGGEGARAAPKPVGARLRELVQKNPVWMALAAFACLYLLVLTLFLREGRPGIDISGVSGTALPIEVRIGAVDFQHDTASIVVLPDISSPLVAAKGRLITDIAIEIDTGSAVLTHVFTAGSSPVPWTSSLPLEFGDTLDYPFDRHGGDFHISAKSAGGQGGVPDLEMEKIAHGFTLNIKGEPTPDAAALNVQFQISRSGAAIFLTVMAMVSLFLVVCSAINVAWQVHVNGRKIEFSMMTWLAALLFVIPAVRNGLPGAPPPGALIDVGLFFWLHVLAVSALLSVVWNWSRKE